MLARKNLVNATSSSAQGSVIALAPIYNADGDERVSNDDHQARSAGAGMGQRANARGLDPNRDSSSSRPRKKVRSFHFFEHMEATALHRHPHDQWILPQYSITYEDPRPRRDAGIIGFTAPSFSPASPADSRSRRDYKLILRQPESRSHRLDDLPGRARYGTTYMGLRNRLGLLSESYACAPYKDRVLATRDFVRESLIQAASHKDKIIA